MNWLGLFIKNNFLESHQVDKIVRYTFIWDCYSSIFHRRIFVSPICKGHTFSLSNRERKRLSRNFSLSMSTNYFAWVDDVIFDQAPDDLENQFRSEDWEILRLLYFNVWLDFQLFKVFRTEATIKATEPIFREADPVSVGLLV